MFNFSVVGAGAACMAAAKAPPAPDTPPGPGLAERFFGGAMADLFAKVDAIGQSTAEVGKEAIDYVSRTPTPAVVVNPPLPLLPSLFQVVRKAAALPSAPLEYVLGKTVPAVLTVQALPYTPPSEWTDLPKRMLDPLLRA